MSPRQTGEYESKVPLEQKKHMLGEQCFACEGRVFSQKGTSISFWNMRLSLEHGSSPWQTKAFRFNLAATEAHQMIFRKEN